MPGIGFIFTPVFLSGIFIGEVFIICIWGLLFVGDLIFDIMVFIEIGFFWFGVIFIKLFVGMFWGFDIGRLFIILFTGVVVVFKLLIWFIFGFGLLSLCWGIKLLFVLLIWLIILLWLLTIL